MSTIKQIILFEFILKYIYVINVIDVIIDLVNCLKLIYTMGCFNIKLAEFVEFICRLKNVYEYILVKYTNRVKTKDIHQHYLYYFLFNEL